MGGNRIRVREGDGMMEAEVGITCLKMGEGATSKGPWAAGKVRETDSPLEPPGEMQFC